MFFLIQQGYYKETNIVEKFPLNITAALQSTKIQSHRNKLNDPLSSLPTGIWDLQHMEIFHGRVDSSCDSTFLCPPADITG